MAPELSGPAERLGPYRILKRLGAGGMGEVFLAYDDRLDRQVAIKRIRPESGLDPQQRERFRREARMAAGLSHPAILQVYDIVQENDTDSIVMEYVEGADLRKWTEQGPLDVPWVLEVARELADGLDAAHRQGIVHRDFKAENVLITPGGRPKIADFGIAKRLLPREGEEELTRDRTVLGTCRSMSPEQARGEPLDSSTDLFSLGVLLYEALTGRSPFEAENELATLNRVIHHRQTSVRELNPAVPEGLANLVDHLLEKEPLLRPRSAGQVRRDLDRLALATASETSRTETFPQIPFKAPEEKRHEQAPDPGATAAVPWRRLRVPLLALLVLVGLGTWAYVALRPARPPLYVAVLAPEIGTGAEDGELGLLASGVRVALLQGLVSLEGISPQAFEEVDAATGSPREVARAVAADELVGTRLDCRSEVCRVALTRRQGVDGSIAWADSFDVPTDDAAVVASAVRSRIQQGYSGHEVREGTERPAAARDIDELLRLRARFDTRREPSMDAILARLEAIRQRSPRFLEACLLETYVLRQKFAQSRDPKDLERALKLAREAGELAPTDPRPLFELTEIAIDARRFDLAERGLERLKSLVPGDARLLERQSLLASAQGEGEKALELMRTAARLQPSGKRLFNLAQMELQKGQAAAARKTLDLLLQRSPKSFTGLSLLAQIELSSGNLNRAVQLYTQLVRLSPGIVELTHLGLAYTFLGRPAEAAKAFKRAHDMQPKHPALALNLADAYLLLERRDQAEALYRRVVELIETDPAATGPDLLTVKAQALAHLGQGRQAVAAVQEALRLAPDQGVVAFEASLVYALLGEEDSALANAEKAVRQGIGAGWFSLPWFARLRSRTDFRELMQQARPGLG